MADHPRIRGEHRLASEMQVTSPGSSPHTRGAQGLDKAISGLRRIIPAYAGSTDATYPFGLWYPDHPRIRGEHATERLVSRRSIGSSPHTRGARYRWPDGPTTPRIIPAYAGSTPAIVSFTTKPADHPRIRGEHRPRGFRSAPGPGSSPHTRGAPLDGSYLDCSI